MGLSNIHTSILVVNYNSSSHIENLLQSLSGVIGWEMLILDNDSSSSEREKLHSLSSVSPRVFIVESNSNLGFGAGINVLARAAMASSSVNLWILNPDTEVMPGALEALSLGAAARFGLILSPVILSNRSDPMSVWFRGGTFNSLTGAVRHTGFGDIPVESKSKSGHVATQFMTGAAPFLTKQTWKHIGDFREDLFLYWEDVEWSSRAGERGVSLEIDTKSVIVHKEGGSSGSDLDGLSETYYYYSSRNRILVAGHCAARANRLFGFGLLETARLAALPLFREVQYPLRKFWMVVRGSIHGLFGISGNRIL